jgi:hypothetical protein
VRPSIRAPSGSDRECARRVPTIRYRCPANHRLTPKPPSGCSRASSPSSSGRGCTRAPTVRCTSKRARRTSGLVENLEAAIPILSSLIRSVTFSSLKDRLIEATSGSILKSGHRALSGISLESGENPCRNKCSAMTRYKAPVSNRKNPSRRARSLARVDLPAPAGPSMAIMTRLFSCEQRFNVRLAVSYLCQ